MGEVMKQMQGDGAPEAANLSLTWLLPLFGSPCERYDIEPSSENIDRTLQLMKEELTVMPNTLDHGDLAKV